MKLRGTQVLTTLVIAVATLSASCASRSSRVPETSPGAAEPNVAAEAGSQRPVSVKVDEEAVFPPAPADGIYGVSVPAIVYEPVVFAKAIPLAPEHEGISAHDVPKPARRSPKGRGFPAPVSAAGEPTELVPGNLASIESEPPAPLAPSLLSSFDSLGFNDNVENTLSAFIPPDVHAAAGANHVVSVVNSSLQFHLKDGTPLLDTPGGAPMTGNSLSSFFLSESPLTATFDPKVLYDQFADRWVIVTLEQTDTLFGAAADTSRILVAVSDDGDPSGDYIMTAIDSKEFFFNSNYDPPPPGEPLGGSIDHWADYPGFAVDEEAVYITANMFGFFSNGAPFGGVRLWIIDKGLSGGFYDGSPAMVSVSDPYAACDPDCVPTTTQPAHVFCTPGATCPPITGTYLVSYSGLNLGVDNFLQVVRVDNPVTAPTFTQEFINIGDFEDFATGALPDAPQKDTGELVEVNDRRALDAVWRDNQLFMTATVEIGNPVDGPATAYWWMLDTTTGGATTVTDQGAVDGEDITVDSNPVSTFFPSISINAADEIAIGFSASSATIHPGSYYTTRKPTDAVGTTSGSETLRAGADYYIRTFDAAFNGCQSPPANNRWGDYSGAALDPIDQCFWVYNQHAITRSAGTLGGCNGRPDIEEGRWGTAFGKLCIDCAASPLALNTPTAGTDIRRAATINVGGLGDVTGGDLTLEGQTITFDDGFRVDGVLSVFSGFCPL